MIAMITVASEFFQRLVDRLRDIAARLEVVETGLSTLFRDMRSRLKTRFGKTKAKWEDA